MTNFYRIGNAQTIGRREIQSNYFATSDNDDGVLYAVLADGAIDHLNGRRAAIMSVEYCVRTIMKSKPRTTQDLYEIALNTNKYIQDMIYLDKSPRVSLTICIFANNYLQYFNVGANRICLYNGHGEQILNNYTDSSYSAGRYLLTKKDIIGIFTAGVYTSANPIERIDIIGSMKKVFDKAQAIIESINGKNLDNQMNATALLIEVVR